MLCCSEGRKPVRLLPQENCGSSKRLPYARDSRADVAISRARLSSRPERKIDDLEGTRNELPVFHALVENEDLPDTARERVMVSTRLPHGMSNEVTERRERNVNDESVGLQRTQRSRTSTLTGLHSTTRSRIETSKPPHDLHNVCLAQPHSVRHFTTLPRFPRPKRRPDPSPPTPECLQRSHFRRTTHLPPPAPSTAP